MTIKDTYSPLVAGDEGETLALTTNLASLGVPGDNVTQALLYNPSRDFRAHFNPAIKEIWFYDDNQTGAAKWISLKTPGRDLTDRTTTGSGTVLDSMGESDRILVCFSDMIAGFYVDMTVSVNATTSRVMQVRYTVGATWTALTETDGTKGLSTNTLGESAAVTFTAPTDGTKNSWGTSSVSAKYGTTLAITDIDTGLDTADELTATEKDITMDINPSTALVAGDYFIIGTEVFYTESSTTTDNLVIARRGQLGSTAAIHSTNADVYLYRFECPVYTSGYWFQIQVVGGTVDSDTEIQDIWSLNKNSNRSFFLGAQKYVVGFDREKVGAIEAILAAGADTLQVSWIRSRP